MSLDIALHRKAENNVDKVDRAASSLNNLISLAASGLFVHQVAVFHNEQ